MLQGEELNKLRIDCERLKGEIEGHTKREEERKSVIASEMETR